MTADNLTTSTHCRWTLDDIDDYWQTGCCHAFQFNDAGPDENEFEFCPYCGGPLLVDDNPASGVDH